MKKSNHKIYGAFFLAFYYLFFSSVACSTFFQTLLGPKVEKTKPFGPIDKAAENQKKENTDRKDQSLSGRKTEIFPELTVVATILNIRSGPGGGFSIIGQCKKGDRFQILDKNNDWIKIKLEDKKEGWVYGPYTEKTKKMS
jgi:uncharacterized protein YgiM (DUF1202 family)